MNYNDFFSRYGRASDAADHTIYLHCYKPSKLRSTKDVIHEDKSAEQYIKQFEGYIETLKEHRRKLAERYAQLETMNYKNKIEFTRYRNYNNSITYYIRFFTIYEDGAQTETAHEAFTGKERHRAIKRFAELKKLHPGYEFVEDIAKSPWER